MEEPVCEHPAVALYYISQLASKYVKVLISGEGGDETFAGYQNYRNLFWLERIKKLMGPLKGLISAGLDKIGLFDNTRLRKYIPLLGIPIESYYFSRTSNPFTFFRNHMQELYTDDFMNFITKNNSYSYRTVDTLFQHVKEQDVLSKMLYIDTKTWLPDDLLIKADKMTMANSVELRVPLLDHTVLEFATSLPSSYKLKGVTTKYILKKTLRTRVPKEILDRKKTGFPVPYERWLRYDLKEYIQEIFFDRKSLKRGYFKENFIKKCFI